MKNYSEMQYSELCQCLKSPESVLEYCLAYKEILANIYPSRNEMLKHLKKRNVHTKKYQNRIK